MKTVFWALLLIVSTAAPVATAQSASWVEVNGDDFRAEATFEGGDGYTIATTRFDHVKFARGFAAQHTPEGLRTTHTYILRTSDGKTIGRTFQMGSSASGTTFGSGEVSSDGDQGQFHVGGSVQNDRVQTEAGGIGEGFVRTRNFVEHANALRPSPSQTGIRFNSHPLHRTQWSYERP